MNNSVNPYQPPQAALDDANAYGENTSGQGKGAFVPNEVKGWSWGGFLWGWIWAVGNNTWIGLLCLVPYLGFIMQIYLGIKGRELAWQNKRWDDVEHFNRVQRKWALWWLGLVGGVMVLGIGAAIIIPAVTR